MARVAMCPTSEHREIVVEIRVCLAASTEEFDQYNCRLYPYSGAQVPLYGVT
jgi:hypothetical protein